jgi:membrane protein DedA with SNARE-associated domain
MTAQLLTQSYAFLELSKYFLLGAGAFFEGSGAMMAGGYLLKIGLVSFWPLYITLIVADVASDVLWYVIGYYGARKFIENFGHYFTVTPEIIAKLEKKFKRNDTKILVISKLTMGLGLAVATLMTAGMLRISFRKYLVINTLGSIVWVLFLVGIGHAVGNVLSGIPAIYQLVFALIAFMVILFSFKHLLAYVAKEEI